MTTSLKNSKDLFESLEEDIKSYLLSTVSLKRYNHIIRVSETAKKYAKALELDHYKARLSGLLHDIAKEVKPEELLNIAKLNQIPLDETDIAQPHILHARVGAILAKEKYNIVDPEILGGIRCHTLAEPFMDDISMVVFLADATEPERDEKTSELIRKILKTKGLKAAVLKTIDSKLSYQIEKGGRIHPLTIQARNWLINELKSDSKKQY